MIVIGTEGGLLPAPAVVPPTPMGYEYQRRSITVLNVFENALLLGPAERADVIVDFSRYAPGTKLILYNDAPAPVPAFDPRIDYYTGDPDQTATGGAPSTAAGSGPNTRTIMQFVVAGSSSPYTGCTMVGPVPSMLDCTTLAGSLATAYKATQDRPIVAQSAYGPAFGTTFPDQYGYIFTGSSLQPIWTFIDGSGNTVTAAVPNANGSLPAGATVPLLNKAIQELFTPDYGRMNATLGVELPFTGATTQTTVPLGYVDPTTETIPEGQTQIWKITHNGVDTHAIHFHLVNVQVINRVGWDGTVKPPREFELGWKETVQMNPLEDILVAARGKKPLVPFGQPESVRAMDVTQPLGSTLNFTGINPVTGNPVTVHNALDNFGWEYVWHCHLLGHEENDMMRPIAFVVSSVKPAAPGIGTATRGVPTNQVTLTWTEGTPFNYSAAFPQPNLGNLANEIGFQIQRATLGSGGNSGSYSQIGAAPANTTTFTDPAADVGNGYAYRVIAFNAAGNATSGIVKVAAAAPNLPPAAPSNLTGTVMSATQVRLTFTDNAVNETGFAIERALVVGGVTGTFVQIATVGVHGGTGLVTFNDNTVAVGQTYAYQVKAVNLAGSSGYTSTQVSTAILAPTNLTATVLSGTAIRLNWVNNAKNNTAYKVERQLNVGAFSTLTSTLGAGASTYTNNTGLFAQPFTAAPNIYTYRVTAINVTGGVTTPSTPDVTVNVDFRRPATPTGLAVGPLTRIGTTGNDSVTLTWTTVPIDLAATYTITRATNQTFTTGVNNTINLTGTSTTLTVPRGTVGVTRYWFRITAVNPVGSSTPSAGVQSGVTN
jgi:FtsP/CotA-like multicopper oxidase with cupredoxin domain